jgi:propane monooxygenase large subunit
VAFAAEYEGRPTPAMGRFSGRREWEECYHGWDLADAIKDLGFVRGDGKTLVPQPHLQLRRQEDVDAGPRPRPHARQPAADGFRALTPMRAKRGAEYRKGFKINPCN